MEKLKLCIGWAHCSITPDDPVLMEGQMYPRVSRYVHDPITATALALDNKEQQAVLVSLDMTEVPLHAMGPLRIKLADRKDIPFDKISFHVTHTHNSTSFYDDFLREDNKKVYDEDILPPFDVPENTVCGKAGQSFLVEKLAALIVSAWDSRRPGGISYAHDYAAVAFNRRPQFMHNGGKETAMYGDCSDAAFCGFESGTDTAVELLYTWDEQGDVTGVACNVPCPAQVHELHYYLTADYWASARQAIGERLGTDVYVLPMCGAAGDLAPVDLVRISKTNKEELKKWGGQTCEVQRNFDMEQLCRDIGDRIAEAVLRGFGKAKNAIDAAPVFCHEILNMSLPIRRVSEEDYQRASDEVRQIHARFTKEEPMTMEDLVRAFEPQGVVLRYRQQQTAPEYSFCCHILRLGNIAIATNPFELYHAFGQRIKARAAAEQVFVVQLANGLGGYLPTQAAVEGGSYSAKPASTVCGPDGGDVLVEKTLDVIDKLWR